MSLLIKALEQAAKDRKAGRGERADAAPAAAPDGPAEPTLEPLPPPRAGAGSRAPERTPPAESSASARAGAAGTGVSATPPQSAAPLSIDRPAAQRRPASSLADLANIDAQQRARAAAVMQAGGGSAATLVAFFRGNPVMLIGGLAVLAGLVFGIYVYLQVANPGLFVRQGAATRPQDTAPPASPVPAAAQPVVSGLPETAAPGGPAIAGAPVSEPLLSPASPAAVARPAGAPIATSSVIGAAPAIDLPRSPAAERAPEARRERGTFREAQPGAPAAGPAQVATADTAGPGRERINVSPSNAQPRLNPMLSQAYASLQGGNVEEARALYTRLSQAEPLNIDALLGLAYIAAQENRSDDAMKLYLRILQLNPRHAVAQGAMIGLMGRADPAASESRLKQLISREPSAFLHFVLGNLYADQSAWQQAQQAYFQAHHLEPQNPDYAYNLAVSLDHLRQDKLALNYYRSAEQLASAQGRSNFNLSHARERIRILSSQLE